MGRSRIRQHVNPLGAKYIEPRAQPVMAPAHLGPHPPIDVELGCADAEFSFELATGQPTRMVVGLDIREKLVDRNQRRAQELGLRNLQFGYVNLNVDLDRVFSPGTIDRFHLLFPDPWFKGKHRKRRVIDRALCDTMGVQLRPGGELHIASDIFEVALEIMDHIEGPDGAGLGFVNRAGPWSFWRGNPFAAASRRERTTVARGQRVWRLRYCSTGSAAAAGSGASEAGSGSASASGRASQRS